MTEKQNAEKRREQGRANDANKNKLVEIFQYVEV